MANGISPTSGGYPPLRDDRPSACPSTGELVKDALELAQMLCAGILDGAPPVIVQTVLDRDGRETERRDGTG